MSRKQMDILVESFPLDYNRIEIRETVKYDGFVQKVNRVVADIAALRDAFVKLGWTPPQETVPTKDIDKALVEIAGTEPQAPMLAYLGEGRWMTGGVMTAEQITQLAALVRSAKP